MGYYWFNRQELLQKAKEKYDNGGKEKAAKYYQDTKDVIKEKEKNKYKNLSDKEKEANAWDKYHNKGGKQKAAKYYAANQEVLREDARNKYRNLSEKEKHKKRKYQRERYHMNTDLNGKLEQYQRNYYA